MDKFSNALHGLQVGLSAIEHQVLLPGQLPIPLWPGTQAGLGGFFRPETPQPDGIHASECFSSPDHSVHLRFRGPGIAARDGHCTQAARRDKKTRSSSAPTFGAAARPKTAVALTGGVFLRGRVENSKSSSSDNNISDGQNCDQHLEHSSPHQHRRQKQQSIQAESFAPVAAAYGEFSTNLMGGGREGVPKTATRRQSGVEEIQPLPQLQLTEARVTASEERDPAHARGSSEARENDKTSETSDRNRNIPALPVQEPESLLSERPSTAPALFEKLLHLPNHDDVGAERGIQEPVPASTAHEEPATVAPGCDAARPSKSNASHLSTCSAGGSNRSENGSDNSSSFRCTPQPRDRDKPEEARPHGVFATATPPEEDAGHLTATSIILDTEVDLPSPVNLRPPTAEARRRPSIEVVAALSRSSRLPPPSCSLSLGSEDGFTLLTGSMIGGLIHSGNGGLGGRNAQKARGHLAGTEASAEIGPGVDITIMGLTSQSTQKRLRERKGGVRSSREGGGGSGSDDGRRTTSTMNRRFRRQEEGKTGQPHRQWERQQGQRASATGSDGIHNTSRPTVSGSQLSSAAALSRATGTTWTQWRRPGDLGELNLQADLVHCTHRPGGRRKVLGRATNGAAAGAGWEGNDQVHTIVFCRVL